MARPTTIVCGPPCSGKTTHVTQHAQPGDTVIDWDLIAIELGSPVQHLHPKGMLPRIAREYDRRLEAAAATEVASRLWIVRGLPDVAERQAWATRYSADVVLVCPPLHVLLERARRRPQAELTT